MSANQESILKFFKTIDVNLSDKTSCQQELPIQTIGFDDDFVIEDDISKAATEEEVQEGLASGKIEKIVGFDYHAGRYWIYPINRDIRDYQYSISFKALFNNTLVVLPTGLGKTLIAAVVMYNYYLWYPQCKIVFMAPTRPLVKQQMEACFEIVGIPKEDIVELTGSISPANRQHEWESKRLFFLTPQVMQNDLFLNDFCPAHQIKCIVVDEAHKATGGYAYTRVIEEVSCRNSNFRVLALSATPGKDLMHIKQVIKNLRISKIEYRSEESLDVQQYTFQRKVETIKVQLDDELLFYRDKLLQIIEENLKTLVKRKAISGYDLNRLSSYYLLIQKKTYEAGQHNIPVGLLNATKFTFAVTTSLIYSLDLLKNHGLRSFYNHVKGGRSDEEGGKKGFSLSKVLKKNIILQEILEDLQKKFEPDGNATFSGDFDAATVHSVPGHPKLVKLQEIVLNHFNEHGSEDTRIIIFSQFRSSVEEITCLLRQHEPTVRPVMFVGQSSVKKKGFSQKQQLEVVKKFRDGDFNVLIATCVAEEGLDIGNVDLIICYDANKSPIRLVQRMGRTGRAREGKIIILTTEGKETEAFKDSIYNKKRVKENLLGGVKIADLYQDDVRLYPKGIKPICRKLHLGIRKENEEDENADLESFEESSTTKKASSDKKKSNSIAKERKRKSTETPGAARGPSKKRKNRFILEVESDGDAKTNSHDDEKEESPSEKPKNTKTNVPKSAKKLKSPKTSTGKKEKRAKKNNLTDNIENTMESEEIETTLQSKLPKTKSFSSEESGLKEIINSPCKNDLDQITPFNSLVKQKSRITKKLQESDDDEEDMIMPFIEDGPDSPLLKSPLCSPQKKPNSQVLQTLQISQSPILDKHVDEINEDFPKSQKVTSTEKRSKWAEYDSDNDSFDSLDLNPFSSQTSTFTKNKDPRDTCESLMNDSFVVN